MLLPKRVKHRKQHRGRMTGVATRGNKVTYGEYFDPYFTATLCVTCHCDTGSFNLCCGNPCRLSCLQTIFPDKPITARPADTRMGKGKGNVDYWVAVVKPGRVMFELAVLTKQ